MTPTPGGIRSACSPDLGKLLAVVTLVAAVSLSAQYGFAQTTSEPVTVDSVTIAGLRSLTQQQILAHLRTTPGQPFDQGTVQKDIDTLGELKLFRSGSIKVDLKMVEGKSAHAARGT